MKSIEAIIQRKVELQELQKKEENENKIKELMENSNEVKTKIKELMENSNEVKTWVDIMDTPEKRTVEVIAKSLKERESEEKERQNRRNITVFELPESKKSEPEDRKEEVIKFLGFCKGIIKINFVHSIMEHIIRLGKAMDDKHQSLLISLKEEDKT